MKYWTLLLVLKNFFLRKSQSSNIYVFFRNVIWRGNGKACWRSGRVQVLRGKSSHPSLQGKNQSHHQWHSRGHTFELYLRGRKVCQIYIVVIICEPNWSLHKLWLRFKNLLRKRCFWSILQTSDATTSKTPYIYHGIVSLTDPPFAMYCLVTMISANWRSCPRERLSSA